MLEILNTLIILSTSSYTQKPRRHISYSIVLAQRFGNGRVVLQPLVAILARPSL